MNVWVEAGVTAQHPGRLYTGEGGGLVEIPNDSLCHYESRLAATSIPCLQSLNFTQEMTSNGFDVSMSSPEMSAVCSPFTSDTILDPILDCIGDSFRCPQFLESNNLDYNSSSNMGYYSSNSLDYNSSSNMDYNSSSNYDNSSSSNLDYSPASKSQYGPSSQDINFMGNCGGIDEGEHGASLTYRDISITQTDELQPSGEEDNVSVADIDNLFLVDVENDVLSPRDPIEHHKQDYQADFQTLETLDSRNGCLPAFGMHTQTKYFDRPSSYPMMSLYDQSNQQSLMAQNIPNLPRFKLTNSPLNTSGRYNSIDEDTGSDSDYDEPPRKGKRGSKSVLLWKFLLEKLEDPNCVPEILCWENRNSGIFKFVDTSAVAKLWGQQKRKQDMNFEKLSRGIRHYYKPGMMTRVEGKRLVYKFNWKKVPREYRRRW